MPIRRSLVWQTAGLMLGLSFIYELAPAMAQDPPAGSNSVVRLAQSEPRPSGYYRYDRANPDGSYSERVPDTDRAPDAAVARPRDDAYRPPRADAWRAPPPTIRAMSRRRTIAMPVRARLAAPIPSRIL